MKIYTKTGDAGQTGLFGGTRVSKADARVAAYGEVDELNSVLGLVRAHGVEARKDAWLARIQSELLDLGAELATIPSRHDKLTGVLIEDPDIERLESAIDELEVELEPLKTFILPGGGIAASALHLARTVCRRAERAMVGLATSDTLRPQALRYVNRLSDLLFVMARSANHDAQVPDVPWIGRDRKRS
jgi:cob(I)alamin adenosyltransferase